MVLTHPCMPQEGRLVTSHKRLTASKFCSWSPTEVNLGHSYPWVFWAVSSRCHGDLS